MQSWYTPDEIWPFFDNAKTQEDFALNWVVVGRFHNKVPEDILQSYITVEYLMAHAWYHWPMFDEALKKLLGMVEMSVKFRCKDLGVDLFIEQQRKGGKQKKKDKNLYTLIDELSKAEPSKDLKVDLDVVRILRNYYAHPKDHNFMGGIAIPKIKNIVNLINLIFLNEADSIAAKEKAAHFEKEYGDFKDGLFVLEYNQVRILVTEMELLEVFQVREEWVYICFFHPVLKDIPENLTQQRYALPPILVLKQPGKKDSVFEAVDFVTTLSVKVIKTTHPDDQKMLRQHQQDWDQLDENDQSFYLAHLKKTCRDKVRDFKYQHRWI